MKEFWRTKRFEVGTALMEAWTKKLTRGQLDDTEKKRFELKEKALVGLVGAGTGHGSSEEAVREAVYAEYDLAIELCRELRTRAAAAGYFSKTQGDRLEWLGEQVFEQRFGRLNKGIVHRRIVMVQMEDIPTQLSDRGIGVERDFFACLANEVRPGKVLRNGTQSAAGQASMKLDDLACLYIANRFLAPLESVETALKRKLRLRGAPKRKENFKIERSSTTRIASLLDGVALDLAIAGREAEIRPRISKILETLLQLHPQQQHLLHTWHILQIAARAPRRSNPHRFERIVNSDAVTSLCTAATNERKVLVAAGNR